jgi:hypothetical protein
MADPNPEWAIYIPLASALSGAAIGAFGSQFFAARNKEREDLLKEVRSANAACTIAYSMTDGFIGMKRDIVKPTVEKFRAARERAEVAFRSFIPGVSVPIDIPFDLETHTPLPTPSPHLQDIVYKSISAPVRAISAMAVLHRTVVGLHDFHVARNALCDEFRLQKPQPNATSASSGVMRRMRVTSLTSAASRHTPMMPSLSASSWVMICASMPTSSKVSCRHG